MRVQPWMKFSLDDFCDDPAVRQLPLEAQAVWLHMIRLMRRGDPYGHLASNGQALSEKIVARYVGADVRLVRRCVAAIVQLGVSSVTADGIIFCRRMVRDAEVLEKDRANGRKGSDARHGGVGERGIPREEKRREEERREDLFGAPLEKPKKKSKKEPDPSSQQRKRLYQAYETHLKAKRGLVVSAVDSKAHRTCCDAVLKGRTEPEALEVIQAYVELEDDYLRKRGWPFCLLAGHLGAALQALRGADHPKWDLPPVLT